MHNVKHICAIRRYESKLSEPELTIQINMIDAIICAIKNNAKNTFYQTDKAHILNSILNMNNNSFVQLYLDYYEENSFYIDLENLISIIKNDNMISSIECLRNNIHYERVLTATRGAFHTLTFQDETQYRRSYYDILYLNDLIDKLDEIIQTYRK